ncbi:type II toxin-antitoxin system VapC family toxin [Indioceanicola profundi]|uniref:type II toxin-antitoxin system VapC family toxin n=1 Tax=Indioceanicola profundi TaxID=2220096 RepID=UPI000E6AD70B|nr:type II toxin-antitoxin system VapC family toxin [Indioceanicola profundi]
MIVDSSALIAILAGEDERERFMAAIADAPNPRLSAASYMEVALKVDRVGSTIDGRELDVAIAQLGLMIEPVTVEQAKLARQAFQRFGRGRHPAALNFGDCFVYALAKAAGAPLLFKGNDFSQTDLPLVEA